jgi:hypothetical protein
MLWDYRLQTLKAMNASSWLQRIHHPIRAKPSIPFRGFLKL